MSAVYKPVLKTETLFSLYATDAEITAVRERYEAIYLSEGNVRQIEAVLQQIEEQIRSANVVKVQDYDRAAAVALGEISEDDEVEAEAAPESIPLHKLNERKIGISRRLKDAQEIALDAKGKFRAAVSELLHQCALRCAAAYEEYTRKQAWCHQQLSLVHTLIGDHRRIIDWPTWNRYLVPGSYEVPLLKEKSVEEWGILKLMSADRLTVGMDRIRIDLAQHGKELFGEWPL